MRPGMVVSRKCSVQRSWASWQMWRRMSVDKSRRNFRAIVTKVHITRRLCSSWRSASLEMKRSRFMYARRRRNRHSPCSSTSVIARQATWQWGVLCFFPVSSGVRVFPPLAFPCDPPGGIYLSDHTPRQTTVPSYRWVLTTPTLRASDVQSAKLRSPARSSSSATGRGGPVHGGRRLQPCFRPPRPPNLTLSTQFRHSRQSLTRHAEHRWQRRFGLLGGRERCTIARAAASSSHSMLPPPRQSFLGRGKTQD